MTRPTREVGYASGASNLALADDNYDLRFPESVRVFAKMGRQDAQVRSVLRAITLPIRRATWRLDPNGAPVEIVSHVSEDLRLPVLGEDSNAPVAPRSGRVSWNLHLEQALSALQFGHMFFEQVYAPGADGREHLVKLAPRWPGTISKINVADDGGLHSITQNRRPGRDDSGRPIVIPVDRLVAYTFEDVGGTWEGTSVLRPAYKHWKLRDELLRLELVTLDRNGMGVPVYTGSDLADDPKTDLANGQKIVEGLRSGEHAGAAIPMGSTLEIAGTKGQLVSPREAITYHDNMIARAVLAHFLNLDGKGGSYALAETQSDLFVQSLQTTAEWVADVATQHIVEDLVRVAYPHHDGLMPRVVFDPIASKKELTAQDLAALSNAGLIYGDKVLEEELRRRYTLPGKQSVAEALRSKVQRRALEDAFGVPLSNQDDEPAGEPTPPSSAPEDAWKNWRRLNESERKVRERPSSVLDSRMSSSRDETAALLEALDEMRNEKRRS